MTLQYAKASTVRRIQLWRDLAEAPSARRRALAGTPRSPLRSRGSLAVARSLIPRPGELGREGSSLRRIHSLARRLLSLQFLEFEDETFERSMCLRAATGPRQL